MSDFDRVLERLLTDQSFAGRLAADPVGALAGYELSPEEIGLLSTQLSRDTGASGEVEARTSQASMFGLFAPLAGAAGLSAMPQSGFGAAEATAQSEFGAATGQTGFGAAATEGLAAAGEYAATEGFGAADGLGGAGGAQVPGMGIGDPLGGQIGGGHGSGPLAAAFDSDLSDLLGAKLDEQATTGFGAAEAPDSGAAMAKLQPPVDYRTRVDVDGDGRWDAHYYVQRADGGVDIVADMNKDGQADFIGHDFNRDGLVDSADYDKDRDGRFETHMFDDNGDGWLDRKIVSPPPPESSTG